MYDDTFDGGNDGDGGYGCGDDDDDMVFYDDHADDDQQHEVAHHGSHDDDHDDAYDEYDADGVLSDEDYGRDVES